MFTRGRFHWVLASLALCTSKTALAQQQPTRNLTEQTQVWFAYMSQLRFGDSFSLWNDVHLVPQGFGLLRTGLTYHVAPSLAFTGGFAFLVLPLGPERHLERPEYRPWTQLVYTGGIDEDWSFLQRIRAEARLRRNVFGDELAAGFDVTARLRYMVQFRRNIAEWSFGDGWVPYGVVGGELLAQFGDSVVLNPLDQNRLTAGVGITQRGFSFQVGYMNRLSQLATAQDYLMSHALLFWVFHNFDIREAP